MSASKTWKRRDVTFLTCLSQTQSSSLRFCRLVNPVFDSCRKKFSTVFTNARWNTKTHSHTLSNTYCMLLSVWTLLSGLACGSSGRLSLIMPCYIRPLLFSSLSPVSWLKVDSNLCFSCVLLVGTDFSLSISCSCTRHFLCQLHMLQLFSTVWTLCKM